MGSDVPTGATGSAIDAGDVAKLYEGEEIALKLREGETVTLFEPRVVNFEVFWHQVWCSAILAVVHVAYQLATDKDWAERRFKSYSATDRLRKVGVVLTGEIILGEE